MSSLIRMKWALREFHVAIKIRFVQEHNNNTDPCCGMVYVFVTHLSVWDPPLYTILKKKKKKTLKK